MIWVTLGKNTSFFDIVTFSQSCRNCSFVWWKIHLFIRIISN